VPIYTERRNLILRCFVIGRELVLPTFACSVTPPAPALSRLRKVHDAADHLAKTAPDILAKSEVARAIEQALVEAMVFCLADSPSNDVRNVQRHRARVMRRLEEALMANPEEPLYMVELAAQVVRPIGHCVTVAWSIWA
jgi:hypothetical protein